MAAATVGVWMSLLWWLWRWRRRRRLKHQQQQQQQRQAALEVLDTEATKRQLRLRAIERAAMMARASAVGETSQDDRGEEQVEVGDVAVAASPIADEEQARSSCSRSSSSPHSKPAYPQMPWWRWALGGWARRPRDPPSRVAHNDARSAPSSDASSSSSTLRSPLYHMLAAEAHATLLSMRSISLNEGGPREEHTNGSWRHDLALAPLKPLQYVHGRMQEIHNEQGAGDAEQLTGALVAVAREAAAAVHPPADRHGQRQPPGGTTGGGVHVVRAAHVRARHFRAHHHLRGQEFGGAAVAVRPEHLRGRVCRGGRRRSGVALGRGGGAGGQRCVARRCTPGGRGWQQQLLAVRRCQRPQTIARPASLPLHRTTRRPRHRRAHPRHPPAGGGRDPSRPDQPPLPRRGRTPPPMCTGGHPRCGRAARGATHWRGAGHQRHHSSTRTAAVPQNPRWRQPGPVLPASPLNG
eukprot:ctg_3639.g612